MPPFLKKLFSNDNDILINITSMIDVLFILLIFFMISTQFKKSTMEIELPKLNEQSQTVSQKDSINIYASNTRLAIENDELSIDELETVLIDLSKTNADKTIIFSGDRILSYQRFLEIYSAIEKSGFSRIAIEHDPLDN